MARDPTYINAFMGWSRANLGMRVNQISHPEWQAERGAATEKKIPCTVSPHFPPSLFKSQPFILIEKEWAGNRWGSSGPFFPASTPSNCSTKLQEEEGGLDPIAHSIGLHSSNFFFLDCLVRLAKVFPFTSLKSSTYRKCSDLRVLL